MPRRDITEILPEPIIPDELYQAAQIGGRVIPFIGASVSRIAGCPSWEQFANKCLKFFVDNGKLNYCDLEQLNHLSPRIKLSLAMDMQDSDCKIDFDNILKFDPIKCAKIYQPLEALSNIFVTTNYDPALKTIRTDALSNRNTQVVRERRIVYKRENFSPELLLSQDVAIHIHGHVQDRNSMVISTTDYLNHYAASTTTIENPLLTFLKHLFKEKNVLFVGYGLEELEILEYVFSKASLTKGKAPQHYFLQGFYSYQLGLANHLCTYFKSLGVQLIPFLLDNLQWNQLIIVLEHLSKNISANPILSIEKQTAMEELLDND